MKTIELNKVYAGRYTYALENGACDIYKSSGRWTCDIYTEGVLMVIVNRKTLAGIKEFLAEQ